MLKLSPINFQNVSFKQGLQNRQPAMQSFGQDEFVRSSSTNPRTEYIDTAKKNEEAKLDKFFEDYNFFKRLPEILTNDENIMGKGNDHKVYRIPDCEDYVIRVNRYADFCDADFDNFEFSHSDWQEPGVNIGQKVGNISVQSSNNVKINIEILKKQSGIPIGNPPFQAIRNETTGELRDGEEAYDSLNRKQSYAESLKALAEFPEEAYEKLISDYKKITEAGYLFDYLNSNNLFYDKENKSINFIDMEPAKPHEANWGNLLYALVNIDYFTTYASKFDNNPIDDKEIFEAIQNTTTIISKFIKAMKKQNVKFDFENKSCEFCKFLLSMPVAFLCRAYSLEGKEKFFTDHGV